MRDLNEIFMKLFLKKNYKYFIQDMIGDIQKNMQVKLFSWFQILVAACCSVRFGRIFEVCCCLCSLTIKDMAEEVLGRHSGTRQVYRRHVSNAKREILYILQTFEPENEESVTILESLRDGLAHKLVKIKATDDSILALLDQKESEKELNYSGR